MPENVVEYKITADASQAKRAVDDSARAVEAASQRIAASPAAVEPAWLETLDDAE